MEASSEEPRRHRSISQLKSFTKCGERFRLERLNRYRVPEAPAPWTALGVAFHDAFQTWEMFDRSVDPVWYFENNYDQLIDEYHEKQPDYQFWQIPPPGKSVKNAIKNYRERGTRMATEYEEVCRSAPWEISHIEEEFEIELDGITVKGGIDRILFFPVEEEYVIEDLKTGNIKGEEDVRQLGFYAFAAREVLGIPVNEGRYWFTKVNRGSEFVDLTKYNRLYWEREFRLLDTAVNQQLFLSNPGDQCNICSVKTWCRTQGTEDVMSLPKRERESKE